MTTMTAQMENTNTRDFAKATTRLIRPCKEFPAQAEKYVRSIFKEKPSNLDLAATELVPLYGLNDNASHDVVARVQTQAIFVCPELQEHLGEFVLLYLNGEWSLPVGDWRATIKLIQQHKKDPTWHSSKCPVQPDWTVNHFYARFLLRMLREVRYPVKETKMLGWLRRADHEDVYWVLFHALMYLQLDIMQFNRSHAPLRDVASHYANKFPGVGTCL
ncbi:Uu.00g027860.m01.CDS01 [Anthostomella pinea]|uniref:Uu.00g027860.m01.CDS01 n=1 Tax=Anthostomella pinea TaxID=933095 RepID=A0AAI8V7V1_9PEZI|nr:Uu.00g027860.m01.CDS01 [Anthostomella pinea]